MKINLFKVGVAIHFLFIMTILFSCNNDDLEVTDGSKGKTFYEPIKIPSNTLNWDESYHPEITTKGKNYSSEMAVTSSNIFVGGIYTAASIQDLSFSFINSLAKSIDVSYTFPRYYFDHIERPSISGMYRSLNKAVESPSFIGKQSLSFEYDFREFSYYSELKLAFGANVSVGSIFKLDASLEKEKIKSTSGLFARIVQKNFSLIMDYPENGNVFFNEADLNKNLIKSPVYINSIIFGRMAILAIESNYSYDMLKAAFKASLSSGIVDADLNITAQQKKILQESQIKLFVSGGASQDVAKIVEGFDEFKKFIINGSEFTKEIPGVPIFFTANYAKDNSVFNTTFEIQ